VAAPTFAQGAGPPAAQASPTAPTAGLAGRYPGEELIDIGGRKLQLVRRGQGSPTVVFEDGLGASMGGLLRFVPRVAEYTSAVIYSRAGNGPSDPAPGPRDAAAVADDLRTMLARAGCKGPYVLVGYSVGALYVRAFAMKFPGAVGGLVLIEGTPERYLLDLQQIDPKGAAREFTELARSDAAGFAELKDSPGARGEWEGLYQILMAGELGVRGSLPDVPLVVISGVRPEGDGALAARIAKMKREEHAAVFQSASHGMHIVTARSGHDVMEREPDLVANAIKWVVDEARKPR